MLMTTQARNMYGWPIKYRKYYIQIQFLNSMYMHYSPVNRTLILPLSGFHLFLQCIQTPPVIDMPTRQQY